MLDDAPLKEFLRIEVISKRRKFGFQSKVHKDNYLDGPFYLLFFFFLDPAVSISLTLVLVPVIEYAGVTRLHRHPTCQCGAQWAHQREVQSDKFEKRNPTRRHKVESMTVMQSALLPYLSNTFL